MRTRCRLSARAWLQYYQQPRPPSRLLGRLRQFWDAEHPLGNRIAPILALGGPWCCACGVETASPAPHRVVAMRTGGRLSARLPYKCIDIADVSCSPKAGTSGKPRIRS